MEPKKTIYGAVTCPYCQHDLHPSEVFMPSDLMGKPTLIVRDPLGKLLYAEYPDGEEPCLSQEFECPSCGKAFVAAAKISYSAEPLPEDRDFSEEAVSLL